MLCDPEFPEVTMESAAALPEIPGCHGREVLGRIGDKWSLYVIHLLGGGTRRFSELRRHIGGITPRMLTVTIRSLERDGLISRTVYRSCRPGWSTRSPRWASPCSRPRPPSCYGRRPPSRPQRRPRPLRRGSQEDSRFRLAGPVRPYRRIWLAIPRSAGPRPTLLPALKPCSRLVAGSLGRESGASRVRNKCRARRRRRGRAVASATFTSLTSDDRGLKFRF